jgi:hypothetical protein
MASTGKKWLIGCGGGCAAIIVISILALIGAGVMFKRPFDKAIDAREILDTTYGTGEDFVPPVDGLSPDRIKRFLAVRKGLEELCGDFEAIGEDFEHMEKLDSAGDEPSTGEVLKGVGNILGSVMQMPGLIGKLAVRRNELLLENEMGLGEYTWIYVLAYHSWLGYDPNTSFDDEDSGVMTRRTRHLMQSLMRNHAAGGRPGPQALSRQTGGQLLRGHVRPGPDQGPEEGDQYSCRIDSLPEVLGQGLQQDLRVDGLGQVVVHTRRQAALPVAGHGVGGHGQNGHIVIQDQR